MASGEAEPLQYTTTVLRVSIHCEGCKKKVKKVLHGVEGVYKVTVDAAQHKVVVTGSIAADALIRRLSKAGKQAALWPAPPPAAEAAKKIPEEVAAQDCKDAVSDKADAKPKDKQQVEAEGSSAKKPDKDNKQGSSEKKDSKDKKPAEKAELAKPHKDDGKKQDSNEAAEAKEKKGSSTEQPPKEAVAAEDGEDGGGSGKKGGKKKNKQQQHKDVGGEGDAAATENEKEKEKEKKPTPLPAVPAPAAAQFPGPERPHGGAFPYYAAQPVVSYNVAHPSASVSYYAPTPAMPLAPPHQVPYGYPPYPAMAMPPPPPEYMYGPPGMRASPPQESYNNMFHEENANSCSLM